MAKVKIPETPAERLELAKRYLQNAKDMLRMAGINKEIGFYEDVKYVSAASGTAYLAALEALRALLMEKMGWDSDGVKKRTKDIGSYRKALKSLSIGKDRDALLYLLRDVYNILHLGGYYRELQDKKAIDSGFEKVAKIIQIVEKHITQP